MDQTTLPGVLDMLEGSPDECHRDLADFVRAMADRLNTSNAKTYRDRGLSEVLDKLAELGTYIMEEDLRPPGMTEAEVAVDHAVAAMCYFLRTRGAEE